MTQQYQSLSLTFSWPFAHDSDTVNAGLAITAHFQGSEKEMVTLVTSPPFSGKQKFSSDFLPADIGIPLLFQNWVMLPSLIARESGEGCLTF